MSISTPSTAITLECEALEVEPLLDWRVVVHRDVWRLNIAIYLRKNSWAMSWRWMSNVLLFVSRHSSSDFVSVLTIHIYVLSLVQWWS